MKPNSNFTVTGAGLKLPGAKSAIIGAIIDLWQWCHNLIPSPPLRGEIMAPATGADRREGVRRILAPVVPAHVSTLQFEIMPMKPTHFPVNIQSPASL